jgi:hypothetical protein
MSEIKIIHPDLDYNDLAVITELKSKAIKSQRYTVAAHLREAEKELQKILLDKQADQDIENIIKELNKIGYE